jgi:pimeloyl-ACP methyl ester carboxylesterase
MASDLPRPPRRDAVSRRRRRQRPGRRRRRGAGDRLPNRRRTVRRSRQLLRRHDRSPRRARAPPPGAGPGHRGWRVRRPAGCSHRAAPHRAAAGACRRAAARSGARAVPGGRRGRVDGRREGVPALHPARPRRRRSGALDRITQSYSLDREPEDAHPEPFTQPTLHITGRQDDVVGYSDAWDRYAHYPRASFAVLDAAGHNIILEQAGLCSALIADWLDRMLPAA